MPTESAAPSETAQWLSGSGKAAYFLPGWLETQSEMSVHTASGWVAVPT